MIQSVKEALSEDLGFEIKAVLVGAGKALLFLAPGVVFSALLLIGLTVLYRRNLKGQGDPPRVLGYLLGFAALGVTLGVFSGFASAYSNKDLFDPLLPGFLAIFSGFVAYLTSKDTPEALRPLVPGSLVSFLSTFLFCFFYVRYFHSALLG